MCAVTDSVTCGDGGERLVLRARGGFAGAAVASIALVLIFAGVASAQRTADREAETLLRGVVLDARTGSYIEGASVLVEGRPGEALTNSLGIFEVVVSIGAHRLKVEQVGYRAVILSVVATIEPARPVEVQLSPMVVLAAVIRGVVLDATTGTYLEGARVFVEGGRGMLTDSVGAFELRAEVGSQRLAVDQYGYEGVVLSVEAAAASGESIEVALTPDASSPDGSRRAATTWTYGQVADADTRDPLSGAIVELPDLGIRVISDELGRIDLGRLAAGRYRITAERVGYDMIREGELPVPSDEDLVILLNQSTFEDPSAPGRIVGRVTEEGGIGGVANVEVRVLSAAGAGTVTDAGGRFDLGGLEPGLVEVQFTHLSYAARATTLVVQPGETVEISAAMSTRPIELEAIEVTVRSRWLAQSGFYRRMERSAAYSGRQFTRAEIDEVLPMLTSDVVRRVAGVRTTFSQVRPDVVYALGRRSCRLSMWVDGVRMRDPDINQIPVEWAEGMEIYYGLNTPIEFGGGGTPCGAVVIWTRRGY